MQTATPVGQYILRRVTNFHVRAWGRGCAAIAWSILSSELATGLVHVQLYWESTHGLLNVTQLLWRLQSIWAIS
jgi:hypothetical protein